MRKCTFFMVLLAILAFQLGRLPAPSGRGGERLTQVERSGRHPERRAAPGHPRKVDDGVQTGDVLRTKSLSKAQITFIDDSTLTIAPESRVGIEAYMVDSPRISAMPWSKLFQGLAHVVVNKVFKAAEPDFVVKTQTAIMGCGAPSLAFASSPTVRNFKF